MAKKNKANRRKQRQAAEGSKMTVRPSMTRRQMFGHLRNGAIGISVLAGVGYLGKGWFDTFAHEHDLALIGQGKPSQTNSGSGS